MRGFKAVCFGFLFLLLKPDSAFRTNTVFVFAQIGHNPKIPVFVRYPLFRTTKGWGPGKTIYGTDSFLLSKGTVNLYKLRKSQFEQMSHHEQTSFSKSGELYHLDEELMQLPAIYPDPDDAFIPTKTKHGIRLVPKRAMHRGTFVLADMLPIPRQG